MRILGFTAMERAELARSVGGRAGAEERFARAAWSCLVEPGDGVAGALVGSVGAERALALVDGAAAREAADGAAAVLDAWAAEAGTPDLVPDAAVVRAALDRWRPRVDGGLVGRALRQAHRFATRLIVPGDAAWPLAVGDLGQHAPLALWVRGDPEAVTATASGSVALVGARAASGYGERVAVDAAAGLVDRGFVVVSGAAYGIDGAAHRAALASAGLTVAVLAGGVDRFYPSGHQSLLTRIVERGAVIAEPPCGTAPSRWRFLQRNRIIAAMAGATVVVEAGWRSGSLNTAGHAAALGRPLGAVPGPVTSAASAGCHRLLREYDAVCVTTAAEMAELVPGAASHGTETIAAESRTAPDSADTRVLDALSARAPKDVATIARESGLAPERVRAELGVLRLDGRVHDAGSGWTLVAR